MNDLISQLGLDSSLGIASFFLTVASLALPVLISYNKRKKRAAAKNKNIGASYILIANFKNWHSAQAKILKFAFAKNKIAVTKKKLNELMKYGASPLVAVVEYTDRFGIIKQAEVFAGDELFTEGDVIKVKYNLENLLILEL